MGRLWLCTDQLPLVMLLNPINPNFANVAAPPNKSLQLTFDSPLGLATPSPHVDSNAAELRRWATKEKNALGAGAVTLILSILGT